MELVCIVCPRGCKLKVEGEEVSGNFCGRGKTYALQEIKCPMRSVTSTVKINNKIISVKTSGEIPKDQIFAVQAEINKINHQEDVTIGDVLIKNVLGLGVDIIATKNSAR